MMFLKHELTYNITDSESLSFQSNFLDNINNVCTKNVKSVVPMKYLTRFLKTIEVLLFNHRVRLILIWSENYIN